MKELINTLNTTDENKKKLELFLINCSLDKDSKVNLVNLLKEIVNE